MNTDIKGSKGSVFADMGKKPDNHLTGSESTGSIKGRWETWLGRQECSSSSGPISRQSLVSRG